MIQNNWPVSLKMSGKKEAPRKKNTRLKETKKI